MPRKGENIYKRKDGRWEGRVIECYNEFGKAKYKSFYGNSYTAVKEKIKLYSPINRSALVSAAEDLFCNCASKWLSVVKLKCKISTYNKYSSICKNHIFPIIGHIQVSTVTAEQIEYIVKSKPQLSSKTKNDILCVVKMILLYAQSCGFTVANVRSLSVRQTDRQIRVLTLDEQRVIMSYLLNDTNLCKLGVYLSLCTGIRIGELCALKRENISFDDSLLKVRGTMQRVQIEDGAEKTAVIISEPKSRKSLRDIPLPEFICTFFKQYYENMPQKAYLLTGRQDKFVEPRLLEYRFKKYMSECGLNDVNFHALRHTFATRCVENGFEIKTLSEILGHVNVNITLNRYVHSSMDLKRVNMEKLTGVF